VILLLNPNGSEATTTAMLAIARAAAPGMELAGLTNHGAAPVLLDPAAVATAEALLLARPLPPARALITAAFAVPGLVALRARGHVVTGIAEAGMAEAPGRFAVVTTTPALAAGIAALAERYGHAARFAGVVLTEGEPAAVMAEPARLAEALLRACTRAVAQGAESIVIGGGPLAESARAIAPLVAAPLVEPVPAAVRLTLARLQAGGSSSPGSSQPS
jgi:Asp/Glu/hydantoin racemase